MELISNDVRKQYFRFDEIIGLIEKKDGRRQLTFDDKGYVDDIDVFLTGCMSGFPISMHIDGSTVDWKLLNSQKKMKTLLDFLNGKITCQGFLYSEIEGYLKGRILDLKIDCYVIDPGAEDKEKQISFLSI